MMSISMQIKKQIFLIILLAIVGIGLGLVFANPVLFRICTKTYTWGNTVGCLNDFHEGIAQGLVLFAICLIVFSSILVFLKPETFRAWFNFTKFYLLISFAFILLSSWSPGGGGFGGPSSNFDGEAAAWFTSGLFFIISILLIIWKSWRLRGKPAIR